MVQYLYKFCNGMERKEGIMSRKYYYKYRKKLNISHSIEGGKAHKHTLDIEIVLLEKLKSFSLFEDNERQVEECINRFNGEYINDLEEFKNTNSTIEDIGHVLFDQINNILKDTRFDLYTVAVSETPARQYVVSDFLISGSTKPNSCAYDKKLERYINENRADVVKKYNERKNRKPEPEAVKEEKKRIKVTHSYDIVKKDYALDTYSKKQYSGIRKYSFLIYSVITLLFAALLFVFLNCSNILPNTQEIYIHAGKAKYLLSQLKSGNPGPIYMKSWFDGYMMFMHSEPLTYYFLALVGWIVGGKLVAGYALAISVLFIVSTVGFVYLGRVYNKTLIGFLCGLIWYTLPEISRHYLITGDIKVLVSLCFFPYLLALISLFFQARGRFVPAKIVFVMWLIVLSDLSVAIVVIGCMGTLLLAKMLFTKQIKEYFLIVGAMILSILLSAGWLYTAYRNGSIPEFYSNNTAFFVSVVSFIVLLASLAFAYKQLRLYSLIGIGAGFLSLYNLPVLVIIMYAAIIYVIFEWKKCDRKVLFLILLAICISNIYRFQTNINLQEDLSVKDNKRIERAVKKAEKLTNENLLYLDIDRESSYPGYYLTKSNKDVIFANKSSQKYNTISDNLQMLKYAAYTKRFYFIFDRSLEMGCDTVLFNTKGLILTQSDYSKLQKACNQYGYRQVINNTTEKYLIFHKDITRQIGNIARYEGISIGRTARNVSLVYPYFENGASNNLDDYSIKKLSKYKKIYLSGFKYKRIEDAEKKLKALADRGIDIYIDMDTLPVNPLTNRQVLFGVTAQVISFKHNFPEFTYKGRKITPRRFYKVYKEWNTVYIEELDKITGYSDAADRVLPYTGDKGEHIHFMGFNILYHVIEANDVSIQFILDDFFGLKEGDHPVREAVNLDVNYAYDKITVNSNKNNVIVPISYQKVFDQKYKFVRVNNMIKVSKGKTVLRFNYPIFRVGVIISIVAVVILIVSFEIYRRMKKRNKGEIV